MQLVALLAVPAVLVALPSCFDLDPGEDVPVPVDASASAMGLAHTSIQRARPLASSQLIEQLVGTRPGAGLAADLEASLSSLSSLASSPPESCPFVAPPGDGSGVSCAQLSDVALAVSSLGSASLAGGVLEDVTAGHQLSDGERGFVSAWTNEAVRSGHHSAAIVAIDLLRAAAVCDVSPTHIEQARIIGEQQGRVLLEETTEDVLPHIPAAQCNTDLIARTVLAEAHRRAFDQGETAPLCDGVAPSRTVGGVDLDALEPYRLEGVERGLDKGYEVLRVQLAHAWTCDPSAVEEAEPCHCYARWSGSGPVYCFYESQFTSFPPSSGSTLERMADAGEPQCFGDGNAATPIGSPLVFDLDGDGVRVASRDRVRFDLAGTGLPVRIGALTGDDAFLALDLDGDGRISSGRELFGNYTRCGDRACVDGIEALARHDANGDGVIDASDPVYASLRLWRDANGDGIGQPEELRGLADVGVVRVSLTPRLDLAWVDVRGNGATRALTFDWADGRVGVAHDVWFAVAPGELANLGTPR